MDAGPPGPPDAICEGGDLDCGSGLLLIIREAMAPLPAGGILEVRSRESSVKEDLPAWCRLVGHALLGVEAAAGGTSRFRIRKAGGAAEAPLAGDLEQARRFAWSARVRWTGGMQARAFVRNHALEIGQPASFDTRDAAPGALEHLLAALGGCVAVGFPMRAARAGLAVRQLEVVVKATADNILVFLGLEETGHPGLAAVELTAYVDADGEDDELRRLLDETLRRSPVMQTIARPIPVQAALRRA